MITVLLKTHLWVTNLFIADCAPSFTALSNSSLKSNKLSVVKKNFFFPTLNLVVSPVIPSKRTDSSATHSSLHPGLNLDLLDISVYTNLVPKIALSVRQPPNTHVCAALTPLCFQLKFMSQLNSSYSLTSVLLASTSTHLADFLSNLPCCKVQDSIASKLRSAEKLYSL